VSRRLRAKFEFEVEQVVGPVYARRHELEAVVVEFRTALADHLDAADEEAVVLGRALARLETAVESLQADVTRLTTLLEGVVAHLDAR
jgi:hypothetical protein